MKIKTVKDVEKLNHKIKNELGIDVRKYRNEEAIATFLGLLVFPEYIISWVIRPIFFAIAVYIIGFFFIDLVHIEYIS